MLIEQQLVSSSKYDMLCPNAMTPRYITVHNTDNDASAQNERDNVANNSTGTSFHVAVDNIRAIQLIPFNRNAWHCGDGNGTGNRESIGVEICYSMSGGSRYYEAEYNATFVVAQLMKQFNIPISNVRTHQSWSGKYCPRRILDEGRWNGFIEKVKTAYNCGVETEKPIQSSGIGIATSNYDYGINMYNCGDTKTMWFTGHQITDKTPYLILDGVWYGGKENMLCLGWEQWVKQEYFNVQWFYAYSKYPDGYGINTYDDINGNWTGTITSTVGFAIWARKDGWLCLGNNKWVKEEHFNVR